INALASVAADPASSAQELHALGNTLPHSVGGTVVLVAILVLNVYKPAGLTPYGWRRHLEERRSLERRRQQLTTSSG
ncbi:MAG: hypothetical protein M3295_00075, partial [Chloroflexota bacterium]|nr:hypothetical protein [Chloroflexota bacterium]